MALNFIPLIAVLEKRLRKKGHPFLLDKPRGHWYPEAIGVVPGYPTTYEKWLNRQRGAKNIVGQTRAATPNGSGCGDSRAGRRRRQERHKARAAARARAEIKMSEIKKRIVFEDYRAELAMEAMVEIMETRDENGKRLHSPRDLQGAANLIMSYTQPKPATKSDVTIRSAEDWLASLDDGAE